MTYQTSSYGSGSLYLYICYLLILGIHAVHSPGTSSSYSIVGYLDNIQIARYDSDTGTAQPRYEWMEDPDASPMWEEATKQAKQYQHEHLESLQRIRTTFNQSDDINTYQIKYQCERYDDGTIGGHTDFGYNGRDFIFFDKDTLIYYPAMQKAQILTQEWNRERANARKDKEIVEHRCIEWINLFAKYVKEKSTAEVRPEVKVWGRQSDGVTRLQCLAYGFHPRAVDVKWVRNGEDHIPSDEASPILPHPDGTYQTRVSVEVPTREGNTYSCHVEHSSLEETLIVNVTASEDLKTKSQFRALRWILICVLFLTGALMTTMLMMSYNSPRICVVQNPLAALKYKHQRKQPDESLCKVHIHKLHLQCSCL
ncbi:major histocompatibility complex class I-related gene protein-like isoform X2 [Hyperolius riggenbachi]|uniref:major histocompatibility complex class I-related gene protein-like isoform X2 n=1 Tax=Hyperolius riggenbachi TaxID=752182 RepID=UPI0035A3870A